MRTFLITWNHRRWQWTTLADEAASVTAGEVLEARWSCGNRKDIQPGERLFLLRQKVEPRGIIGSGWATTAAYQDRHWEDERRRRGDLANFVRLRFDRLLDPEGDDILSMPMLRGSRELRAVRWNTQASGILIPPEAAAVLERLWGGHLGRSPAFDDEIAALEGEVRRRLVIHRHRERKLRDAKIAAVLHASGGRLVCEVPGCGFDFEEAYGDLGRGYAQVHHLEPLGSRARSKRTSLDSLAIVCANCHAMIHRNNECRPLRSLIKRRSSGTHGT